MQGMRRRSGLLAALATGQLVIAVTVLPAAMPPTAAAGQGTTPTVKAETICFAFSGSRLSELEPCNCASGQTGGVDSEAYVYDQLRKEHPGFFALDVGGWLDPYQSANERLKTEYLVKAMNAMGIGVYNITPYDLGLGTTFTQQLSRGGQAHLISANLVVLDGAAVSTTPLQGLLEPYAILETARADGKGKVRVGVIGVTDPKAIQPNMIEHLRGVSRALPKYELRGVTETLKTYVPEVRRKSDFVIVLGYLNQLDLPRYARAVEGIDLFVSSWNSQITPTLMREGQTAWLTAGYQSRYYGQVIAQLGPDNRPMSMTGRLVDIPLAGPKRPDVVEMIEQYKEATKTLERKIAMDREKSPFGSRTSCYACHKQEYLQWIRTPHNMAFATLVQRQQHYNPDCLKCHTTGYGDEGGFVDILQTGHLVGVQCEQCHGAGRAHTAALTALLKPDAKGPTRKLEPGENYPKLQKETAPAVCERCHDAEHDPEFNYEKDVPLAGHKNPNGPFQRPKKPAKPAPMMPTPTASGGRPVAPRP